MNRNDEARRAILGSIRRSLTESAPHDAARATRHEPPTPGERARALPVLNGAPAATPPTQPAGSVPAEPLERFRQRLEAVAGVYVPARGSEGIIGALEGILRRSKAARVASSDSPRVAALLAEACARAGAEMIGDADPLTMFDCDVGVSTAQWGIAETGTLVLESARERHRLVSLIPRIHVALLRSDRICDTIGEALALVREEAGEGEVESAAITLITGPSRTSDIELTLAIGVHGPQELHVIVVEPESGAPETAPTHPEPGRNA